MHTKNNSNNMASLLRQENDPLAGKAQPRGSLKLGSLPEQLNDISAFRISRKKKDYSEVDSEVEPYVTSPVMNNQQGGNIERVVMAESKKLRKVVEELQVMRGKVDELEYRLSNKTDGSRETIQIIRGMQEQYSNEIVGIKSNLQEKRIEEHASMMKEKEKATALFLEVVRLGDALEKIQDSIKGTSGGVENRLQYLEGKSANNDKNMMTIAQRNTTGSDMLSEFVDKVVGRVQILENSLLVLGKQHIKDKEQVSRIDSSTSRIAQDLNVLLRSMQSDIQYKLQNRVSEMVNKLMYQKEQRMRSQDEIRKNLDFRERLIMEKQRSEKEQMESRYLSMDTNIRNQFMRKDESIKNIQELVEAEVRSLQRQIQDGNRVKDESEALIKNQLKKIQEGFRKEYDMYKQQQSDLVTNMEEIIKVEIGARLNSDVDLKNLTNTVATYLATDLNSLKQAFNRFTKDTNGLIKELESNSSNRDSQLSHYVDQQISESMNNVSQKYNKMKTVFTKLTQQFRTHLVTTEANRKSIDVRLGENQKDFDRLRQEVNSIIDDFHRDLESKMKDDRAASAGREKDTQILSKLEKLEEYMNYNIDTLKEGLEANRKIVTTRLEGMKSPTNSTDLRELSERVGNIKFLIEQLKSENQQQTTDLKQVIALNQQKALEEIEEIKSRIGSPDSALADRDSPSINRDFDYKLLAEVEELKTALKRVDKESQINRSAANENFKKIHQDVSIAYTNITELESILKAGLENMDEQIHRVKNDVVIMQGEVKNSEEIVREDIQKLIQMIETESSRISTP